MTFLPADFHFLRPEWFYALVPLVLVLWFIKRWRSQATGWQGIVAGHLYQHLVTGKQSSTRSPFVPFLTLAWMLGVIALAGPTWERIPQPVYQVKTGHIIVMDMSLSMRATDITPDRLSRAKYKAIDLVNLIDEGDMGLVAYAGDAFVISPLTQDASTLKALLPGLSPEIMPVAGSDPVLGLQAAEELLRSAGFQTGVLYWITDGVEISQMKGLSDFLSETPYTVNILGVGTAEGAPIKQLNGELLKRNNGSIVIPKLNGGALQQLSRQGGGRFTELTADDRDIRSLAKTDRFDNRETREDDQDNQGDEWREAGPYLLLLLLPIAALAFRRGVIFILLVGVGTSLPAPEALAQQQSTPPEAMAADTASEPVKPVLSWWQKPFLNADQQGLAAYEARQYDSATNDFDDTAWQGAAQYRNGDYMAAAQSFAALDTAQGYYNQGNALAKAGELDAAIEAYDKALARQPEFPAAQENKELLEQLKEQQEQQQQNDQQQDQSEQDQQNQDDSQQQDGESDNSDQQSEPQNSEGQQEGQQDGQQDNQPQPNDANQEQQNEGEENQQQGDEQQNDEQQADNEARQAEAQQASTERTERDKETQQRLDNLLRRVPDDPAFLLKRKMQLEAQKRQYRRPPDSNRSDW
ncbi:VWA domain-containing protein [Alteromonas gilva]|uniref:VWA domain-containing protein n=1 Tax=Alteromonas gilva TaxID=2987522 RepID=A0ABT5L3G9_9ALTE|nr:VWA domain-containing protein [Alteromonas gilva]MDC8831582.1 VWA domain-containing protein [Alteromonas gilva]